MSRAGDAGGQLRALAARLNARVVAAGQSLASLQHEGDELPERDRSLLWAMLNGSLRWHHRFEWQLGQLLDRPLKRKDAELAALLRIGLTQLEVLRIPDHAAVSATVAATSSLGLDRARGLTNAVLRRYLRECDDIIERGQADDAARFSHPVWLIDAVRSDWPDRWQDILEANNQLPPLWLRVNSQRSDREAYLGQLKAAGLEASAGELSAESILLAEPCPVGRLPGFDQGLVSVQDAAAQLAAGLMQLEPGQRVLDACAAPGGKAAHLLEHCPGLAELVAVDSDAARLELVADGLDRLGLTARLVAADAAEPAQFDGGKPFDRILVDAPCSATGVIRRHPDIKLLRRADDLAELSADQNRLLDALWPRLIPGGRMLYVTCSVLKAENVDLINGFLARTPDATAPVFGSDQHFQLLPGEANTDGFYYACLTKEGGNNK